MAGIARENDYDKARISGNEPTLGRDHLLSVLEGIDGSGLRFILETNGIMIGADPSFVEDLSRFENLLVRVSLKGANRKHFQRLTGSGGKGFDLQLRALENLHESGTPCRAATIRDFLDQDSERELRKKLGEIGLGLARGLEFEELKLYPHVKERLKRHGISDDISD